ncbi:NeuD/PglB/VioB family sugar acetyltransferase [Cellulophaga sp. E16_2]|uniref:NeuD/PglB/VioB family sugar acetyltransferase n=1 Tax=Cellulophaga sp. E16_2 TaxID=2789297 RepID=UPI001A915719|nr:NeuD/PglB/VioB family sugar acetyltransferase [Cellulophaga sp. E16_2]MBO0592805.1 NeuD/PglB/VioB family sugar acetyltransferase [Cellulophaga sp. E16_2]
MKNAVILGGGTYGEVFLTYLTEQNFNVIGFIDDNKESLGKLIHGVPVLGDFKDLIKNNFAQKVHQVFCPIGDNIVRTKYLGILNREGFETPNFIHDTALINKDVQIGNGVYLLPGVMIMPHTKIEDYVIISMGSHIAHHTLIKRGTFISTGVNIGAGILIKRKAFLGISSTIMTGVKVIGENTVIGSGAVVIRDVEDNHVVAGVPAKTLKIRVPINDDEPQLDKPKIKDLKLLGYSLQCLNLRTKDDNDTYKTNLKNFIGYDAFYKTELFSVNNTETEHLKYFTLKKKNIIIALMPFSLRKIILHDKDTTYYDASSFYGYSGPLFNEEITASDIDIFWHLVDDWYKNNKVITEFLRFNLEGNYKQYSGNLIPTLNNVKGKILTDETQQWDGFIPKVRNNYRKAIANGLHSKIYHGQIEESTIETFYDIYISTMDRNNADSTYYFSLSYFKNLILSNPSSTAIILIFKDETPISSELILLNRDTMYSFLGGTLQSHFDFRPNDFLKMEAIKWGRENGYANYILGGGRANEDSLYKYKKTFFPKNEDAIYYTGRKILNEVVYEKLTTLAKKHTYKINKQDILQDFFPLYRKE